jgi:hypothetical protein
MRKLLLAIFITVFATVSLFATGSNEKASQVQNSITNNMRTSREFVPVFQDDFEGETLNWTTSEDEPAPGESWHIAEGGFEGNCWWMQDPEINGYANDRYLMMDSPSFTVPADAQLTFKTIYSMEGIGGTGDYNGWDGFNVRIKVGEGDWEVLTNPTPAYSATSFYSFGNIWGEGTGVPAWGGTVDNWVDVTFDLSAFSGQEVQIRFAFASDGAFSTNDDGGDPSMFGVKVDNVAVETVFTANGSSDEEFTATHFVNTSYWELAAGEGFQSTQGLKNPIGFNRNDRIVSPAFTIPEGGDCLLSYDVNVDMPDYDGDADPDGYLEDYYLMYIKPTDNSTDWVRLHYLWANESIVTPGAWNHVDQEWMETVLLASVGAMCDLSGWAGQEVQISYVMRTDADNDGGTGTGLYIDNVFVGYEQFQPEPENLTALLNGQEIDLDWDSPAIYDEEDLLYTSGTYSAVLSQVVPIAVRIDNTNDVAVKLGSVNFTMYTFDTSETITGTVDVIIWENDNDLPGEEIGSITGLSGVQHYSAYSANVESFDLWIQPGESIFVGVANYDSNNSQQGLIFETTTNTGHTFVNDGGTWSNAEIYSTTNGDLFTNSSVGATILIQSPDAVTPDSYNVYRMGEVDYDLLGSTTETSYTDASPIPTEYNTYVVTAVYGDVESLYSNSVSIFLPSQTETILSYDDGTAESSFQITAPNMMAVKYSTNGDKELVGAQVYVNELFTNYLILKFYNENETTGFPDETTVVGNVNVLAADLQIGWNEIRFDNPMHFSTPNFFVADQYVASGPKIGFDTNNDANVSYQKSGTTWSMVTGGNIMFRAIVDNSTNDNEEDGVVALGILTSSNYPNPFNPTTNIKFNLPTSGKVELNIYNIKGQLINSLVNNRLEAGNHVVTWNGIDNNNKSVASGVYFYKIETSTKSLTKRMVLLK